MKIAIFHDYMDVIGGAELLTLQLAKALDADIITSECNKDALNKFYGFEEINIITLGPSISTPNLKQVAAIRRFQKCNFTKDYDKFIISGNFAIHAAKKHRPNIWYCHTPLRGIYDLKDKIKRKLASKIAVVPYLTYIDQKATKYIDEIVANSKNVRKRISAFYGREAKVIHPPIDTKQFRYKKPKNYWLSIARLYPEKRIHTQIKAFKKLPEENLYIVGAHNEETKAYVKQLKKDCPKNVKFLGFVKDKEKIKLLSECKGFITTAIDEDFGITPVEAMASGKPVIASNEGGYRETVINKKTGLLIDTTTDEIIKAVKTVKTNKTACMKQAKKFDLEIFIRQMKAVLNSLKKT